ncbi:MAG: hypothetical protein FWE04_00405 [Oscillospiraceae bacterium]|nr:hypothetical protein [Oscillospiraceae bacterium]
MNNSKVCCPTNLSAAVFGIANILTEKFDSDELALLGSFFTALGDTISMNSLIASQCQNKN